ncbi:hypothetical protein RJ639_045923 [Escallonia herrerae]|uniref:BHLH domain-containing protein n=1 Tax=Escallonia herrerae TaxID=1293975 RepID=A0AA89AYP0_9ASTE|nr:hypothetical protein RJ639_045923 [Escallonia herrerae]
MSITHKASRNPRSSTGSFNPHSSDGGMVVINSREARQQRHDNLNPMMIHDHLGFHWTATSSTTTTTSAHELQQLARIKEELRSANSNGGNYPKFSELMVNMSSPSSSSSSIEDHLHMHHPSSGYMIKGEERDLNYEKLLLKNFSSGCQIDGVQNQFPAAAAGEFFYSSDSAQHDNCSPSSTTTSTSSAISSRGTFSQIFPTINISSNFSAQQSSSSSPNNVDMNLEALDLFNSAIRYSQQHSPQDDHLGRLLFKETGLNVPYGLDHMQQLTHRPSNTPRKVSPFTGGVSEAKRPSNFLEPKAPQAAPKKSRLETRSSCPPFKVRKEKLGDRIASLQQLVAPFGKTDTASVLMEAIGYINFLQNQVETLSVPYMKSSRNKTSRTVHGVSTEDGHEETRRDLRSRGLCLVPLSCLSYVTEVGGGVWPNP